MVKLLTILAVFSLSVVALIVSIELGVYKVPLPLPVGINKFVEEVGADGAFPPQQPSPELLNYSANAKVLTKSKRTLVDKIAGVEKIVIRKDGLFALVDHNNKLHTGQAAADGTLTLTSSAPLYLGPGRVLGAAFDSKGDLIACDSLKGLLQISNLGPQPPVPEPEVTPEAPSAESACESESELCTAETKPPASSPKPKSGPTHPVITLLAGRVTTADGSHDPIVMCDDVTIASDGTIYLTDATGFSVMIDEHEQWNPLPPVHYAASHGRPLGRLLKYDPKTEAVKVVADGFYFANGLALSADESHILVTDSLQLSITRVWLRGPKEGLSEFLVKGLPAIPDGITRGSDGNFWVAGVSPIDPIFKLLDKKIIRSIMAWLPDNLKPQPVHQGFVIKVSPDGQILDQLIDLEGEAVYGITSVTESLDGRVLYFGSLHNPFVSFYEQ